MECEWKQCETETALVPDMADLGETFGTNIEALQANGLTFSPAIFDFGRPSAGPLEQMSMFEEDWFTSAGDFTQAGIDWHDETRMHDSSFLSPSQRQQHHEAGESNAEDSSILQAFPILEPVENGPRGASLRTLLDGMTEGSSMVRHSMNAFTAMRSNDVSQTPDYRQHYKKAEEELSDEVHSHDGRLSVHDGQLKFVLATVFLLTYTDVCTYPCSAIRHMFSLLIPLIGID